MLLSPYSQWNESLGLKNADSYIETLQALFSEGTLTCRHCRSFIDATETQAAEKVPFHIQFSNNICIFFL